MIVRSNFGKEFALYIPDKFEETKKWKDTDTQLGFYWINGDQLVTVTNSSNLWLKSDNNDFISTAVMAISNDRNEQDYAYLNSLSWSGILVGTDGYPTKDGSGYCIGGGKD